ncbi:MAG: 1-acyl-sn-glycerol-3-phosphate acyltransferase [Alphaproteobacteria bacterium]|nr:1-acyl-sn-glycerol-3-phosphate acyltransferase [Alphaproteobacteria bacterium]
MLPITYFASQKFVHVYIYRICTQYLLICLKYICNIEYKIENKEYLKRDTLVIIGCNHQSAWETFIFSLFFDELSIVIKKELLDLPIAGLYFRRLGCIPIDRTSPIVAIKTLVKSSNIAKIKNQNILIFPNGTRSVDDEHTEYKVGIYAIYSHLNVPVIPAHVDSGKCWARKSFLKNPGTITLKFNKPIEPGLSKEEFMNTFSNTNKESIISSNA